MSKSTSGKQETTGVVALYRKYRPHSFKEVVGQEHIVTVLEAAIKKGAIAHAYLFAGSRGTGKTSIARIFATTLGVSAHDIYEMDAASNRGIDEIRELREGVYALPFNSKYKVYIIDEAHMLTPQAWNAFLKTLEEPPAHVVFIMATTELDKVPETILSRCQVFTFEKPMLPTLKAVVSRVAKEEGYTLEPASAEMVALLGDGSFRDTLGILQKVITVSDDKKISPEEVALITGAPRRELLNQLVSALEGGKLDAALSLLKKAETERIDMRVFARLFLERLRTILLLRFASDLKETIQEELTKEDFEFLDKAAKNKDSKINAALLSALIGAEQQIALAAIPSLPFELAFISALQGTGLGIK